MTSVRSARGKDSGFTLIEVLVSLLILAIGLLGVAALQFRGLQYNHDAYMRSQINVLAYDIADRIRLNADNAASYIDNYTTQLPPDPTDLTATNNGCDDTAAASAANDLACWYDSLDRSLPPGSTAAIADAGVTDTLTVTLQWSDREGNPHTVAYTFRI
jgi:type IV pilus assembly protein PilV